MKRLAFSLVLLSSAAFAATFAGFSIKPYGNQNLDLGSGVTTLDRGGVVTDGERGVTVDAQYVELKEGDFLRARDAKLKGDKIDGTLTASSVEYRVPTGILTATGSLKYSDKLVRNLTAKSAVLNIDKQFLTVTGGVSSEYPAVSGDTLLVDYKNRAAVLQGTYRYTYEGVKLSGRNATSVLYVTWNDAGKLRASSNPTPAQLASFVAFLKK